jgi:hypothetical protein
LGGASSGSEIWSNAIRSHLRQHLVEIAGQRRGTELRTRARAAAVGACASRSRRGATRSPSPAAHLAQQRVERGSSRASVARRTLAALEAPLEEVDVERRVGLVGASTPRKPSR